MLYYMHYVMVMREMGQVNGTMRIRSEKLGTSVHRRILGVLIVECDEDRNVELMWDRAK